MLVVARGAKIGGIDPSTIGRDVRVVRIVNLASHYSGRKDLREFAEKLSGQIQAVSGSKHSDVTAALLLMLEELRSEPAHITVVGAKDEISGQAIVAFVILRGGVAADKDLEQSLKSHVTKEIGAIAKPRQIMVVLELPKTRSGKIMRRLLQDVAENRAVGDATTLADPNVMKLISEGLKSGTKED